MSKGACLLSLPRCCASTAEVKIIGLTRDRTFKPEPLFGMPASGGGAAPSGFRHKVNPAHGPRPPATGCVHQLLLNRKKSLVIVDNSWEEETRHGLLKQMGSAPALMSCAPWTI